MKQNMKTEQSIFIPGAIGRLEAKISGVGSVVGIACHPHPLYEGTMENKVVTTIIRAWQSLDLQTVRFNFRGVLESEGQYGEGAGEIEDLLAVIHWVQAKQPNAKIFLAGFSFGGVIAWKAALQTTPKGLLTIAPALRFFGVNALQAPPCPWLIIQGEKDEIVSAEEIKQLVRGEEGPELVLLPEASHFFHGHLGDLNSAVVRFMIPLLE